MTKLDESGIRFVTMLRDKFARDADPKWLEDPTGITVVEHTGIHELDEETQNQLMRLMEEHQMKTGRNKLL